MSKRLLLLFFTACTLHPKYQRPQFETPSAWRIPTHENIDMANLFWWTEFEDPHLNALIEEALHNNQNLKVAIERVSVFAAKLGIVSAPLYPQVNMQSTVGREKQSESLIPLIPGQPDVNNFFSLIANASYQLDLWGKIRSSVEASKARLMAEVQNRRTVILTLVSAVATTYMRLKQFDRQLQISEETLDTRRQSYDLALIRFQLGLTSYMQVDQALSEVQDAEVRVDNYHIYIAEAEDLLALLIGKPPCPIDRGKPLKALKMPPKIPVALPNELVAQRPDILSAEQTLIAANADIGVARARFFPDLSLLTSYGFESLKLSNLFSAPSSLYDYGIELIQEIYTGGRLTSGLRLSEADMRQSLHAYHQTILNAYREVNDALIAHKITLDLIDVELKRVESLAHYLYLSNLRYQEGQNDYLTFLDAERHLFEAQLAYVEVQANAFTTLVSVYTALGGGWVEQADAVATE